MYNSSLPTHEPSLLGGHKSDSPADRVLRRRLVDVVLTTITLPQRSCQADYYTTTVTAGLNGYNTWTVGRTDDVEGWGVFLYSIRFPSKINFNSKSPRNII